MNSLVLIVTIWLSNGHVLKQNLGTFQDKVSCAAQAEITSALAATQPGVARVESTCYIAISEVQGS